MTYNRELQNQHFSNFDINQALADAGSLVKSAESLAGDTKKETPPPAKPAPAPKPAAAPSKKTTMILGMTPITLVVGALGVLILAAGGIAVYNHLHKGSKIATKP